MSAPCTRWPCDFSPLRTPHRPDTDGVVWHRTAVDERSIEHEDGEMVRVWAVAISAADDEPWDVQLHLDHPDYPPGAIVLNLEDAAAFAEAMVRAIGWSTKANLEDARR